jgi:exonuclease I
LKAGRWQDLDFRDKRLHTLAARMKARSYPALLDEAEQKQWRNFVITKLEGEGDWLNLRDYEALIEQLTSQPELSAEQHQIMQKLAAHGADLRARYGL